MMPANDSDLRHMVLEVLGVFINRIQGVKV